MPAFQKEDFHLENDKVENPDISNIENSGDVVQVCGLV